MIETLSHTHIPTTKKTRLTKVLTDLVSQRTNITIYTHTHTYTIHDEFKYKRNNLYITYVATIVNDDQDGIKFATNAQSRPKKKTKQNMVQMNGSLV